MPPVRRGGLGAGFNRLLVASAISNLGDGIRLTALPLLAVTITREPFLIALLEAAIWLPWLLFALPVGALLDRGDRVRLMQRAQFMRMAVMVAFTLGVLAGVESIAILCVVAFIIGVGEIFVDGGSGAVIPALVPDPALERANGLLIRAQFTLDDLAGPPVGALLFSVARSSPFLLDAASFGISGVFLASLRRFVPHEPEQAETTLRADVAAGLRWLWRSHVVRALSLCVSVTNAGQTLWGAILVLFVLEELGGSGLAFGLVMSAGSAGAVVGTFTAARVARHLTRSRALAVSLLVGGLAPVLVGLSSSVGAAIASISLFGFALANFNVVGRSLRQSIVPGPLLGRIISTSRLLGYGVIPLAAALGGVLAGAFGLRAPFVIGGIAVMLVGLVLPLWVNERTLAAALQAKAESERRMPPPPPPPRRASGPPPPPPPAVFDRLSTRDRAPVSGGGTAPSPPS